MYYVLTMRKLGDPDGPVDAVVRATSEQAIWDFIAKCTVDPHVFTVNNVHHVSLYADDSALAGYAVPDPGRPEEGIIYMGTVEDQVDAILHRARPEVEAQVRQSLLEIERNTIEV